MKCLVKHGQPCHANAPCHAMPPRTSTNCWCWQSGAQHAAACGVVLVAAVVVAVARGGVWFEQSRALQWTLLSSHASPVPPSMCHCLHTPPVPSCASHCLHAPLPCHRGHLIVFTRLPRAHQCISLSSHASPVPSRVPHCVHTPPPCPRVCLIVFNGLSLCLSLCMSLGLCVHV